MTLCPFLLRTTYSIVPPLRNCVIRNSGLISLNNIPLSLQETIRADSCPASYIIVHSNILRRIFEYVSDMSQISRNKNESFKPKLLLFLETVSTGLKTLDHRTTVRTSRNVFLPILTTIWSIKVFLIPWYTHPVLKKYILTLEINQAVFVY